MATSTMNWRAREAAKENYRREAAKKAAEETERKRYENTEENFPTLLGTAHRMTIHPQGFSTLANKWREEDELEKKLEAYKKARSEKERREIVDSIYVFRQQTKRSSPVYEDEQPLPVVPKSPMTEKYLGHGKRGTYTLPDSDGWRIVQKKRRKEKRELTEAELYQKYINTRTDEDEEHGDMNEDLTEKNQRREFY